MPPQTITIDPSSIQPLNNVQIDPSSIQPIDNAEDTPSHIFAEHPGRTLAHVGEGALKGAGSTLSNIGTMLFPDALARAVGMTPPTAQDKSFLNPTGRAQDFGKTLEQAAEFLAPGPAEEAGASKLASLAPKLGKYAAPLSRVLMSALGSGAVNAAQGGSPLAGAAVGAGGGALAEGAKATAPALMEFAQGIKTPGSKTGKALLDETHSIFPGGVRAKAQKTLDALNPQLEEAANRASMKPNPVRAYLPAPPQKIPLGVFEPDVKGELIPAARLPQENITGMGTNMSTSGPGGRIRGVPGRQVEQLGSTAGTIPPRLMREPYMTSGTHEAADLPRSGPGVLIRPMEGSPYVPPMIPNTSVSLAPARAKAAGYVQKATSQNEPKFIKGTKKMARQLTENFETGESIPENVTPRQALDLKRGVGNAVSAAKWRPGYHDPFSGAQKSVYGELNNAFENAVPAAVPLNRRISALIPATQPAKHTFGHVWGPGAGAMIGGFYGARPGIREGEPGNALMGGAQGALEGAAAGFAAPMLLNLTARTAASPFLRRMAIPAAEGSFLQATRKKEK